jgi:hypothetical protein
MAATVFCADIQDRDGGILLLSTLFGGFHFSKGGSLTTPNQGPISAPPLAKSCRASKSNSSNAAKAFVTLPKHWLVERSIALAESLLKFGEERGEPQLYGRRLPLLRLYSYYVTKALQWLTDFRDGL